MTEDPQESESEGDSDLEDKEIKNQDVVMLALLKWKRMIGQKIKEIMSCDDALYYATLVHLCFRVELFYRIDNHEVKVFLGEVP